MQKVVNKLARVVSKRKEYIQQMEECDANTGGYGCEVCIEYSGKKCKIIKKLNKSWDDLNNAIDEVVKFAK